MEPFIGMIVMFGGNFAPRSWALCDGQLLSISANTALFSILGTTYGGDGRTTFGLPDLRGRVAIHPGSGPGLSHYSLGQKGGSETVTLVANQIPQLSGTVGVHDDDSNTQAASGNYLANGAVYSSNAPDGSLGASTLTVNPGGGGGHANIQPFQCVNYIIALQGIFPSRN